LQVAVVLEADREGGDASLLQHVRGTGCGRIFLHAPLRRAGSGSGAGPAGGSSAGDQVVKVHCLGLCLEGECSEQKDACYGWLDPHGAGSWRISVTIRSPIRKASAAMVSDGFTPSAEGMSDASATYSPS